jgi:hypothetical protein
MYSCIKKEMKQHNISWFELNSIISQLLPPNGLNATPAKKWIRVDVGNIETYVGDKYYIISVIYVNTSDVEKLKQIGIDYKKVTVQYLKNEGFIESDEYAYIGLERFKKE